MKMGDSPWQKYPLNLGELIAQFRDPKVDLFASLIAMLSQGASLNWLVGCLSPY
jgi:hypothetical protein